MFFLSAIAFVFVIGILILVHELGHFLTAKLAGIRVEEFGFGMPPRLWTRQRGETRYSLNALPFGGFVRLTGEDGRQADDPRSFAAKPPWIRLAVLLAGVLMNLLLAVGVFTAVFTIGVPEPDQVLIEEVVPDSPAAQAGLEPGDIVRKFNGEEIRDGIVLVSKTTEKLGEEINLVIFRAGQERLIKVTPRRDYPEDQGPMGIVIKTEFVKRPYPIWTAPFVGMREAFVLTGAMMRAIAQMLVELVTQGKAPEGIAGPVGIAKVTGEVAQAGFLATFQFLGFLSLNLAIVNSLPFPALDGGRSVFVLAELITRRKAHPVLERWAHTIGFAVLIVLLALLTIQDLSRIESISNLATTLRFLLPQ